MEHPRLIGGYMVGDCPVISERELEWNLAVANEAPTITEYNWSEDLDKQPAIKWDSAFDVILDKRIALIEGYRSKGISVLPWMVLDSLPKDRAISNILTWNQGSIPSCSMHGTCHSAQFTELVEIALGAPIIYDALNPIYPFYVGRGGNLSGGLTLTKTAETVNETGLFACSVFGDDNLRVEPFRQKLSEAKKRQCAVVYLVDDLVDRIFKAAHAGFYVTFGSNTIYSGSDYDKNGVKVMSGTTHGGHAQCLGSYRSICGTEYVFLQNSHGDRYKQSKEGEPASGAWCDRDLVANLTRDMLNFGYPFITLPENPLHTEPMLYNSFQARFPQGWLE